jgi:hypothetical protein
MWRQQGRGPAFIRLSKINVRYRLAAVEAFEKERECIPADPLAGFMT